MSDYEATDFIHLYPFNESEEGKKKKRFLWEINWNIINILDHYNKDDLNKCFRDEGRVSQFT